MTLRKTALATVLALGVLAFTADRASAQFYNYSYNVTPFGGYYNSYSVTPGVSYINPYVGTGLVGAPVYSSYYSGYSTLPYYNYYGSVYNPRLYAPSYYAPRYGSFIRRW